MTKADIGIIGGSGLYSFKGLEGREELELDTPFGRPSDVLVTGQVAGTRVAFLPRHGRGHRILPSEIPVHANVWALKSLGVQEVISVSAVGSLREQIRPLDFVVPDQLLDRTRGRRSTFFGEGIVAHVGFADPFCPVLRRDVSNVLEATLQPQAPDRLRTSGPAVHEKGTYVVMEGPAFSTRAESELYRGLGASVIGMTALPEAKLAREAELCYAVMAAVTDYDCWRPNEEAVTVEMVVANLERNVANAARAIYQLIEDRKSASPGERGCGCRDALRGAIITAPDRIPQTRRRQLGLLVERYLGPVKEN